MSSLGMLLTQQFIASQQRNLQMKQEQMQRKREEAQMALQRQDLLRQEFLKSQETAFNQQLEISKLIGAARENAGMDPAEFDNPTAQAGGGLGQLLTQGGRGAQGYETGLKVKQDEQRQSLKFHYDAIMESYKQGEIDARQKDLLLAQAQRQDKGIESSWKMQEASNEFAGQQGDANRKNAMDIALLHQNAPGVRALAGSRNKAITEMNNLDQTMGDLGKLIEQTKPEYSTYPYRIANTVGGFAQKLNHKSSIRADERAEYAQWRQGIMQVVAKQVQTVSGLSASDKEFARQLQALADTNAPPDEFMAKLKGFQDILGRHREILKMVASGTYDPMDPNTAAAQQATGVTQPDAYDPRLQIRQRAQALVDSGEFENIQDAVDSIVDGSAR